MLNQRPSDLVIIIAPITVIFNHITKPKIQLEFKHNGKQENHQYPHAYPYQEVNLFE